MWSSIANLKENLNKIALDVHDDDEELEIYSPSNKENSAVLDRRNSRNSAHSSSPLANGVSSSFNSEIEQYKGEIKRLQESEAQIKALSVNYAALLKEKEEQISRLNKENGSLKQNLEAAKDETSRASISNVNILKGNSDRPSNRQHKFGTLVKSRSGNYQQNGVVPKYDGTSNGTSHAVQSDDSQGDTGLKLSNPQGREKEFADLLEERNKTLAAVQATYESQIKEVKVELERQRNKLANIQLRYEEERKLNESFQEELKSLKSDKQKTSMEMSKIHSELDEKLSEIRRLQVELDARETKDTNDVVQSLKRVITTLEKENNNLKLAKNELEAALRLNKTSSTEKVPPNVSETQNHREIEKADVLHGFPGKEEMEKSLQKLEKDLKKTRQEKDKALQELTRLKQHLLEKESEESDKMDEDSKIIEELRQNNEYLRAQISHMERALKQAATYQEEIKLNCNREILKSKETIDDLNRKLANYISTIDSKNVELLNLQTALGQYYAEIEAKEHLEEDLARAREESSRLSGLLKDANQQAEASRKEKEEILGRLGQSERILTEWKHRVNKLEEDNAKLRRALEQSMTRLNRMSLDSDYLVDRRIVIKLLVTYFQRNHSKEVLDLMVRMLGFSDEDKQRIGIAQQGAGKGVVRGVLGIPGRLVGGILGGSSNQAPAHVAPENQSIADLWVDFLLKETEERERREMGENKGGQKENMQVRNAEGADPPIRSDKTSMSTVESNFPRRFSSLGQFPIPASSHGGNQQHAENSSEFSNIPLTSSETTFHKSRTPSRY